jgi:SAM-dependent methyltransferase
VAEPEKPDDAPGLDHERLYAFRFRHVDQSARQAVWNEITPVIGRWLGSPSCVLDPAAGRGEFINAIDAKERWVVDRVDYHGTWSPEIKVLLGDARTVVLPAGHFDAVFISNFLEHLSCPDDVADLLRRLRAALRPGGRIAVMGPNFRYCAREYFDFADHVLALTHVSVEEHLYSAGFEIDRVIPRFLPYSFRSRFPTAPRLVRTYLRIPLVWQVLGQQFLLVGRRPSPIES